jgi:hypothetical protein
MEDAAVTPTAAATAATAGGSAAAGSSGSSVMDGFVLDEASGCFYSSALGYYFNPATQLFRDACSGLWYRYSEETGAYQLVESA